MHTNAAILSTSSPSPQPSSMTMASAFASTSPPSPFHNIVALSDASDINILLSFLSYHSLAFTTLSYHFHNRFPRPMLFRIMLLNVGLIRSLSSGIVDAKNDQESDKSQVNAILSTYLNTKNYENTGANKTSNDATSNLTSSTPLFTLAGSLRPTQRLVALYLLFSFNTPRPFHVLTPAQQQSVLLSNPFLAVLLEHLERLEKQTSSSNSLELKDDASSRSAISNSYANASSAKLSLSLRELQCERHFLEHLLTFSNIGEVTQLSAKMYTDIYYPRHMSAGSSTSDGMKSLQALRSHVNSIMKLLPQPSPPNPVNPSRIASLQPTISSTESNQTNPNVGPSSNESTLLASLLSAALNGTLTTSSRAQLESLLSSTRGAQLLLQATLAPSSISALIERSPTIAVKVLQCALTVPGAGEAYLASLLQTELSLHSLEVVHTLCMPPASSTPSISASPRSPSPPLATPSLLPPDFLPVYISHCMSCVKKLDSDKFAQMRLVRLLCVFVHQLLRHSSTTVTPNSPTNLFYDSESPLRAQLLSFCVEFSKFKEAAQLYRTLSNSNV